MIKETTLEIIMPVEADLLRQAMRFWVTGVTVVTAAHNGVQHGMVVSSFTSVSLTPPQILVSLAQDTRTHGLVTRSRSFGISILSASQQDVSDRFAGRVADELDRLAGLETFTLATNVPLIAGGLAYLDCHVVTTLGSGTHTIFIGEVLAAKNVGDGDPLIYFNRAYKKLV
jgi:flavin reductase (DIM6/NTAB) family NADH-FMN oxidoreductase RutF